MLEVTFVNPQEIRMGSPYNICKVKLVGSWQPILPDYSFQDLLATDPMNRYLALVAWDVRRPNRPGFRVVVIDDHTHRVRVTSRILGCCKAIRWDAGAFAWSAWPHGEGRIEAFGKI